MTRNVLAIVLGAAIFTGAVFSDTPGIRLTTGRPVYKVGPGAVTLTLANDTSENLLLSDTAQWTIAQGSTLVYAKLTGFLHVPAGQSKTAVWNRKDRYGKEVGTGSYTVSVGPLLKDGQEVVLSRTIALTYYGSIAKNKWFPLAKGNEWVYQSAGGSLETMAVTEQVGTRDGSSCSVSNLLGMDRQVVMTRGSLRTLAPSGTFADLFRFSQRFGGYEANFPPQLPHVTMNVASMNGTCVTPAGRFGKCLRMNVIPRGPSSHSRSFSFSILEGLVRLETKEQRSTPGSNPHYSSFVFAQGIGLVRYSKLEEGKTVVYALRGAKLYSEDIPVGGQYTIGFPVTNKSPRKAVATSALPSASPDELNRKDFLLLTDKAVYQAGKEGKVVITLTNKDPKKAVTIGASPWCFIKGKDLSIVRSLKQIPGQSASWEWDKKDRQGKLVPPGSYLITVVPLVPGKLSIAAFQWIALTPTGQLAGNSWFPLSVGNIWHYHRWTPGSLGLPEIWSVTGEEKGWYRAALFLGVKSQELFYYPGTSLSRLQVLAPSKSSLAFLEFMPVSGLTYPIDVPPHFGNTTLKVASVNEKVVTPAGVFRNCMRFEVVKPVPSVHKYSVLWFARGVGLVQYKKVDQTYSLIRAGIKDKDGRFYSIGVEETHQK